MSSFGRNLESQRRIQDFPEGVPNEKNLHRQTERTWWPLDQPMNPTPKKLVCGIDYFSDKVDNFCLWLLKWCQHNLCGFAFWRPQLFQEWNKNPKNWKLRSLSFHFYCRCPSEVLLLLQRWYCTDRLHHINLSQVPTAVQPEVCLPARLCEDCRSPETPCALRTVQERPSLPG